MENKERGREGKGGELKRQKKNARTENPTLRKRRVESAETQNFVFFFFLLDTKKERQSDPENKKSAFIF